MTAMSNPATATKSTARAALAGASALALIVSLAACDPNRPVSKQTIGAGLGAAGGVAIGSQIGAGGGRTAAMIIGGLLGALAGSEIGRTMDENDRLRAAQNTQRALETYPSGSSSTWNNPDSGYSGSVTPQPAYVDESGQYCREYTETISIDGRAETARGVACRQSDGTWRVVSG